MSGNCESDIEPSSDKSAPAIATHKLQDKRYGVAPTLCDFSISIREQEDYLLSGKPEYSRMSFLG
jgi:hypothetical protein